MLCLTPAIRQIRPGAGVCKGGRPRRPGAGRRCRLPHEGVVQTMPSSRPTSSHRSSRRFCACIMMPGKRAAGGTGTGRGAAARRPTRIDIQCPPGRASSHCGPGTWSGPEGSSHNRFPQVPRVRLVPPYFRGRNASSFLLRSFAARVVVLFHPVIRRGSWFPGASRPSPFRFRRHGGAMHRENIASVSCLSGVFLRLKPGASTIPPSGTGPQVAAA